MQQDSPTQSEFERHLAEYCPETPQNDDPFQAEGEDDGNRERDSDTIGGGGEDDATSKSHRTSESAGTMTEDEESKRGAGGPINEA